MQGVELPSSSSRNFIDNISPTGGILLYTTEGGGGHKSAADAIEKLVTDKERIERADVMKDTILPNFIAEQGIKDYDKHKKKGRVKLLTLQFKVFFPIADMVFYLPIFLKTVKLLNKSPEIQTIVDTQPVGTAATIDAARFVNFWSKGKRQVKVIKVLTDMPNESIHFGNSIKKLNKKQREIFTVLSTEPMAQQKGENNEQYQLRLDKWWKKNFNLSSLRSEVQYVDPPLREAYVKLDRESNQPELQLSVKVSPGEQELIKKAGYTQIVKDQLSFDVKANYKVGLITLGSQANIVATLAYVDDVIESVKEKKDPNRHYYLFVACGRHKEGEETLFAQTANLIAERKSGEDFPENLHIVPMGFQSDKELAPMMQRADFGIYGAGGMTTMEVLHASNYENAHVFVHSDAKIKETQLDRLLKEEKATELEKKLTKAYLPWERGNAMYQTQPGRYKNQAKLVIPKRVFRKELQAVFNDVS